ncbi:FtsQ-type POTRA domain-containing protein, partial [Georgenia sp. 10Sc9-8]|nr:FtsQ-type POTRA domain-containing protein [Georgenia halotolerans]
MRPPAAPRPTGRARDPRTEEGPARDGTPGPAAEGTAPEPAARVVVPRREPRSVAVRRGVGSVSTGLRDRLAERDAAARRLLLRKVLLTLLALAVLAAVGWLLLISSVLALRAEEVTVAGTGTTVQPGDVRAAVEPAIGTPLARVDVGQMRERVAAVPNVRSVDVARDWPHGLTVQ